MWKLRIGTLITTGTLVLGVVSQASAAGGGKGNGGHVRVVVSPVITTAAPDQTAISAITITRSRAHKHHHNTHATAR